ncbi:MAG: HEPN domain-containing protein [Cyanobacteria bacterium M_surface_7_m2_040]|nr:HEPN domain-containing protein [Cyanobacteria bacterium K_Offshore_0m_m2_072]MBM5828085.1 HEPN domain-containing protein [Cyanobacteria bacterium M_surface_7_m2_040]
MTPRASAWMLQSSSDLEAAKTLAQAGFHAHACYTASQAAEKALKALVVAAGLTPPYSHSLERLVDLLKAQGLATEAFEPLHLKALTRMNSQSRYPSADEAPADLFDANDSQQALTTAARVVEAASALLAG